MSDKELQIMLMTYIMGPVAILTLALVILVLFQHFAHKSLSKDILDSYDDDPIEGTASVESDSSNKEEICRSFIEPEYPMIKFEDDMDDKKKREKEIENTRMTIISGMMSDTGVKDLLNVGDCIKVFTTEPSTMLGSCYTHSSDPFIPEGIKGDNNSYDTPSSSHNSWSSDTLHSSHSNDWSSSSDNSSYSSSSSYDSGYSSYDSGSSSSYDSSSW